jgi:TonB family protein
MKQCSTCREEFADKFSFCPVDGTPLAQFDARAAQPSVTETEQTRPQLSPAGESFTAGSAGSEAAAAPVAHSVPRDNGYHPTIINDTGLTRRLIDELRTVSRDSQLTWPEFKRDPFGYSKRLLSAYSLMFWRFLSSRNVAIAVSSSLLLVLSAVIAFVVFGRIQSRRAAAQEHEQLVLEQMIETEIPDKEEEQKPDKGVGTGEKGRVGFNKGAGEGSQPKFKKAGGGGGGGQQEVLPTQQGRIPPPSEIPAKIPTTPPLHNPPLPAAGINIDPALYKQLPSDRYGDPRSNSQATSAGPGTGNGLGKGTGVGIGEGEGEGFGKGRGRNMGGGDPSDGGGGAGGGRGNNGEDYTRTFSPKDVSQKARIIARPEPQYTEEARKNQVSGTVVLRAVLSSSGQVTNIRAVSGLPYGLTEKAIAAARQIRFTPASKDGHAVSQYIQIEYNFNLY